MTDVWQPSTPREAFEVTTCGGKQAFENGAQAHRRLREQAKKERSAKRAKAHRARTVYRCVVCRKWHIGSTRK